MELYSCTQSIDLTRLPSITQPSADSSKKTGDKSGPKTTIEYSAREVSPPALLIQQLVQAHHVFSLHHGPSLTELFVRVSRDNFCTVLDRYWSRFSRTWDVLLHGSPATDIFTGIKLSSGGELGMGVGEEEWGSGEREVLEDIARRTEGLVDLVVSRFGEPAPKPGDASLSEKEALPWMGCGDYPLASDGVIFGGINGVTKPSLRNVSLWMRQIYTYGEHAYGIRDHPSRERRKYKRRKPALPTPEPASPPQKVAPKAPSTTEARDFYPEQPVGNYNSPTPEPAGYPGIPPPIVTAVENSLDKATKEAGSNDAQTRQGKEEDTSTTLGIPDQYMKYLTFGLSTLAKPQTRPQGPQRTSTSNSKTITAQRQAASKLPKQDEVDETEDDTPAMTQVDPQPDGDQLQHKIAVQKRMEEKGHFVIGLKGDLDLVPDDGSAENLEPEDDEPAGLRNVLRTVHAQLVCRPPQRDEDEEDSLSKKLADAGMPTEETEGDSSERLRVLVYAHRPFLYCFLFKNRTPTLAITRFYKELHNNLVPIHKPLLASTSVLKIKQRIEEAQVSVSDTASVTSIGSKSTKLADQSSPIYDLLYDPALLTVHTSIPNIAQPGTPAAEGIVSSRKDPGLSGWPAWTRIEALNVHSQILNTLVGATRNPREYERTSKTSRGWWVVYMKLPPSTKRETPSDSEHHETRDSANVPNVVVSEPEELPQDTEETLDHTDSKDTMLAQSTKHPSYATTRAPPNPMNRIAFLVRKSSDSEAPIQASSSTSRAASSMWNALTLRPKSMSDENTGGAGAGWGPAALAGGIGFDARAYVEGLLSLNR